MMGHANFQTTMNIYAGRDEDQMVESSRELGMKYAQIAAKSCRKIAHLKVPETAATQDLQHFWKHLFRTKSCRKCLFHAFGTHKKSPATAVTGDLFGIFANIRQFPADNSKISAWRTGERDVRP